MKGLPFVLLFTAMTFIAWGAYGPVLHHGTFSMGRDSLRAFVGVGIAYFVIAVLVPIYILKTQGETGKWTITGSFYSLIAGAVGAVGALGVILALAYGGKTIYVMPLVFGFAPIVNTLVTAWLSRTFNQISPVFIAGIVVAALGAGGVIIFKPTPQPHAQHAPTDAEHAEPAEQEPAEQEPAEQEPAEKEKSPLNDKSTDTSSSRMNRTGARYIATLVPQQAQDDSLPPVVVQPAAPGQQQPAAAEAPEQPAKETPATDPAPAEPAPVTPVPAAPVPAAPVPAAPVPAAPVADELPPVVVAPQPIKNDPAPQPPAAEEKPAVSPEKPATEPTPADPKPAEPAPTAPMPTEPKPTEPMPAEPKPTEPKPTEPMPAQVAETAPPVPTTKEPQPESKPEPQAAPESGESEKADAKNAKSEDKKAAESATVDKGDKSKGAEVAAATPAPDAPMIVISIIVAALCWGSYGPMLHQGQSRMGGSRLRPFTCVGLAYFFIAVAAPLALIANRTADTGNWSTAGLTWSIAAGSAGAIGALGVILAFNAGGKPYYVMPLIFGFAPVINTFISLTESGTWDQVQPMFWVSLAVVIAGAVTVLINAPKSHPAPHAKK